MQWLEDPRLWALVGQIATNHKLRKEIVEKGPNNYLKEQGVDISPIDISLAIDPANDSLHVKVKNAGDNFKGTVSIELTH